MVKKQLFKKEVFNIIKYHVPNSGFEKTQTDENYSYLRENNLGSVPHRVNHQTIAFSQ